MTKPVFNPGAFVSGEEIEQTAEQIAATEAAAAAAANSDDDPDPDDENQAAYSLEDAFKSPAAEGGGTGTGNLTEELKNAGMQTGESIPDFIARMSKASTNDNSDNTPKFDSKGMDQNGYTSDDYSSISRIENNLKLNSVDRVVKAIKAQYKNSIDSGEMNQDELEEHIDSIKADKIKMIDYDNQIKQSLSEAHLNIANAAKTRIDSHSQERETSAKTRKEALYNYREVFGETLKPEVLVETEKFISSGDFSKEMSTPANAAQMALLWKHRDLINETFKQPGFTDGINEGKKQYFLRASNSELQNSGGQERRGSKQTKGFNPKAFIEGDS
jgi:hypothetical protein